MITEQDLLQAITECQADRNPNSSTCIKLAAFYTILDHIREKDEIRPPDIYSLSAGPPVPEDTGINLRSQSEFAETVSGMPASVVMPIMDELMDTVKVLQPRLYAGVMRKLQD